MKIKLSYATEADIPEGFKDLYAQKDGAWVLIGVEGMKTQGDVDSVMTGLTKERSEHKETKAKLKLFGEHNPDEIDAMVQENTELKIKVEASGTLNDEQVAQLVEAKVRPVQKQLDEVTIERDGFKGEAETSKTLLVDGSRRDQVFAAIGDKDGIRKDASGPILKYAQEELIFDAETKEFRTEAGLTSREWLDGFCDKNAYVMEPSKGGGSGGSGDHERGGDNCFTKENITEQMRLKRSDPVKYERLKKEFAESA